VAGVAVAERPERRVELHPVTLVALIASILALLGLIGFVRSSTRTLTWCVIGALLALALNPIVSRVERALRSRRGVAVGIVLAGFLSAVVLAGLLLGPPAVQQARDFQEELPEVVQSLTDLPIIGDDLAKNDVPARIEEWINELPDRLSTNTEGLTSAAGSIVGGFVSVFFTMLVTVVLLLDGDRVLNGLRRAVPHRHRPRADRLGDLLYKIVGQYFAGSLFVALLAGTVNLVIGLSLGLPLAPLAAVWVAMTNLIPQIGGAAGGIPFVLLGFSASPTKGVICVAYFLFYQQFENHVIQPAIVGDAVDLSPPATMLAALIGVSTGGVPGALVAVPIVGVAKAFFLEIRPPVDETPASSAARKRSSRFRRLLARRRGGSPAQGSADAGSADGGLEEREDP